jgi:hypothetical protein
LYENIPTGSPGPDWPNFFNFRPNLSKSKQGLNFQTAFANSSKIKRKGIKVFYAKNVPSNGSMT